MGWRKFIIFAVTILGISIVVVNNLNQLVEMIFLPKINIKLFVGFGTITLMVISYVVLNKDVFKENFKGGNK